MIIEHRKPSDIVVSALNVKSYPEENKHFWFAHGCNCHCVMGAGVAAQFAKAFPELPMKDERSPLPKGKGRLGNFSFLMGNGIDLFNLYTQVEPGPNAEISAIYQVFSRLEFLYTQVNTEERPIELHIPKISCGIGGLNWEQEVEWAINEACPTLPIIVHEL
tara:strand:- start:48501 stop:48986 length:486 start_codon:yes stop_codon:yes gene_type:complete